MARTLSCEETDPIFFGFLLGINVVEAGLNCLLDVFSVSTVGWVLGLNDCWLLGIGWLERLIHCMVEKNVAQYEP